MDADLALPVLTSKLRPLDGAREVHVPRAQLERLEEDAAVSVIVAPAGFGKSTLLSAWALRGALPVAWLSLDPLDDDPAAFLGHLIAALRAVSPEACRATAALAQPRGNSPPPWTVLARSLVQDVEEMPGPFLLVLDDLHEVQDPDARAFVDELVRHRPAPVRLLISSREAPALPLAKLQVDGDLVELRSEDLLWPLDEAAAYLVRASGGRVDVRTAQRVAERCDGWITALRLAAYELAAGREWQDRTRAAAGSDRADSALETLAQRALAERSPLERELLQRASLLDRFCAPLLDTLCDGLADRETLRAAMERALRDGLFLIPVGRDEVDGQSWFRFHELYRGILRARLDAVTTAEERARLHRAAASWLAAQDQVTEAIVHLLAAQDERALVDLVEARRHEMMDRERWDRHDRWLRLLPRAVVGRHPELLLMEAWSLLNRYAWEDLADRIDRASELLEARGDGEASAGLLGEVAALRSQLHYRARDLASALPSARRALELTPVGRATVRGVARTCLSTGLYATQGKSESIEVLYAGLKENRDPTQGNPSLDMMALSFLHWLSLDLTSLLHTAERLLELGEERGIPSALSWGHYFRGCVRYARDDLTGASRDFEPLAQRQVVGVGATYAQGLLGLASCRLAAGDPAAARAIGDRLAGHAEDTANRELLTESQVFLARLALRAGDAADAERRLQGDPAHFLGLPLHTLHTAGLGYLRGLLGLPGRRAASLVEPMLARLLATASATGNRRVQMEALALNAIRLAGAGDARAAHAALAESLALARPAGALRLLADLRPELDPCLAFLERDRRHADVVARILATPVGDAVRAPRAEAPEAPEAPSRALERELRSSLSYREKDVLSLLCRRKTNREIARELDISPETVKRHASNLYRKLDVGNRREAAALAEELGLVVPDDEGHGRE